VALYWMHLRSRLSHLFHMMLSMIWREVIESCFQASIFENQRIYPVWHLLILEYLSINKSVLSLITAIGCAFSVNRFLLVHDDCFWMWICFLVSGCFCVCLWQRLRCC
jgi:hypothetical protein